MIYNYWGHIGTAAQIEDYVAEYENDSWNCEMGPFIGDVFYLFSTGIDGSILDRELESATLEELVKQLYAYFYKFDRKDDIDVCVIYINPVLMSGSNLMILIVNLINKLRLIGYNQINLNILDDKTNIWRTMEVL